MVITSVLNDKVKYLTKLNKKKYRDIEGKFLVEGEHLVREADKCGKLLELIVLDGTDVNIDCNITYVSESVMRKISMLESIPNMIGVCKIDDNNKLIGNRYLLLDGIQDPGNLGTIIRSSVAFGVDTIVLSPDTVDLYNSKVVRATQGLLFHINVIINDLEIVIKELRNNNIRIYGTNVNNGIDAYTIENTSTYALVMGNEGNGVSDKISNMCDSNLYINTSSKVESLNVGVACSILLYELGRSK